MKKYTIEEIEKNEKQVVNDESSLPKAEKTPVNFSRKKRNKKRRKIIVSSVLVVLLGIIGYFGFITYNALKNVFNGDAPSLLNLLDTRSLKGEKDGRINILLLGMGDKGHGGENLTDTIMVVSVDPKTKDVSMISIPRDLYVKIDNYGYGKINAAHAYGEMYKYKGGGPELAKVTVGKVIDQPIHYYARVDFTGFTKIIDTLGGVDIEVEKDLYDPLYPGGTFSIKKGKQHMNGEVALKYARSRETTSDFDRAARQQKVLVATKEKALSMQTLLNPKKVSDIIQALGTHVKTDMQLWEGQRLFEMAKKVENGKIISKVIDNGPSGLLVNDSNPGSGYILIPRLGLGNYKEIQSLVKNIFMDSRIKTEASNLSVLNGTTNNGLASRFSEKVKNTGVSVVNIGSADKTSYSKSVIYDYTNGQKPFTVKLLQSLLKADVQVMNRGGESIDIEVILGSNYVE